MRRLTALVAVLIDRSVGEGWEMRQVTDGMPGWGITWRKSSFSNPYGNCVELAELVAGLIAVRHSRDPDGPAQIYPRAAMAAFVRAVRQEDFVKTE